MTEIDPRIDLDSPADEAIENETDRLIDLDPIAEDPPTDSGATGIDLDVAQPPEGQQLTDISAP